MRVTGTDTTTNKKSTRGVFPYTTSGERKFVWSGACQRHSSSCDEKISRVGNFIARRYGGGDEPAVYAQCERACGVWRPETLSLKETRVQQCTAMLFIMTASWWDKSPRGDQPHKAVWWGHTKAAGQHIRDVRGRAYAGAAIGTRSLRGMECKVVMNREEYNHCNQVPNEVAENEACTHRETSTGTEVERSALRAPSNARGRDGRTGDAGAACVAAAQKQQQQEAWANMHSAESCDSAVAVPPLYMGGGRGGHSEAWRTAATMRGEAASACAQCEQAARARRRVCGVQSKQSAQYTRGCIRERTMCEMIAWVAMRGRYEWVMSTRARTVRVHIRRMQWGARNIMMLACVDAGALVCLRSIGEPRDDKRRALRWCNGVRGVDGAHAWANESEAYGGNEVTIHERMRARAGVRDPCVCTHANRQHNK